MTLDSIVNDPDTPIAGNPKGDVVIGWVESVRFDF